MAKRRDGRRYGDAHIKKRRSQRRRARCFPTGLGGGFMFAADDEEISSLDMARLSKDDMGSHMRDNMEDDAKIDDDGDAMSAAGSSDAPRSSEAYPVGDESAPEGYRIVTDEMLYERTMSDFPVTDPEVEDAIRVIGERLWRTPARKSRAGRASDNTILEPATFAWPVTYMLPRNNAALREDALIRIMSNRLRGIVIARNKDAALLWMYNEGDESLLRDDDDDLLGGYPLMLVISPAEMEAAERDGDEAFLDAVRMLGERGGIAYDERRGDGYAYHVERVLAQRVVPVIEGVPEGKGVERTGDSESNEGTGSADDTAAADRVVKVRIAKRMEERIVFDEERLEDIVPPEAIFFHETFEVELVGELVAVSYSEPAGGATGEREESAYWRMFRRCGFEAYLGIAALELLGDDGAREYLIELLRGAAPRYRAAWALAHTQFVALPQSEWAPLLVRAARTMQAGVAVWEELGRSAGHELLELLRDNPRDDMAFVELFERQLGGSGDGSEAVERIREARGFDGEVWEFFSPTRNPAVEGEEGRAEDR